MNPTRQAIIDDMKVSMRKICQAAARYPEIPTEQTIRAFQALYGWPKCRQEGDV